MHHFAVDVSEAALDAVCLLGSVPTSRSARLANPLAIRRTKALFSSASACIGVVVTERLGAVVAGSGQSNVSRIAPRCPRGLKR